MKSYLNKLRKKSLTWWTFVLTVMGVIIAFGAWFLPAPLARSAIEPTPTPVLSSFGTAGLIDAPSKPKPGTVRIIIARFDEEDQANYKVTDLIVAKLREATQPYPDTEILVINQVISELDGSDLAQKIGRDYGANIVIWGWYGLTDQAVPLGVHFEVIRDANTFQPITCAASASQVRKASLSEINNLTLQTNMSNELSYVTLFTLGVIRYEINDYEGAIKLFNDAINYLDENTIISAKTSGQGVLINESMLHFYRAQAFSGTGDYKSAISELRLLEKMYPNDSVILSNLAYVYFLVGENEQALEKYTTIINYEQDSSLKSVAYYQRGLVYEKLETYTKANDDFNRAGALDDYIIFYFTDFEKPQEGSIAELDEKILKNPTNSMAYYLRGVLRYYKLSQTTSSVYSFNASSSDLYKAILDFRKTIELNSNIIGAHYLLGRLLTSSSIYDPHGVIDNLTVAFQLDKYRTPCDTQNRGVAYEGIGETEKARLDYEEVIRLTTKEIEDDPLNAYAYYVRGLAYYSLENYYQALLQYKQVQSLDPNMARDLHIHDRMLNIIGKYKIYIMIFLVAVGVLISGIKLMPKIVFAIKQKQLRHQPRKHRHRKH